MSHIEKPEEGGAAKGPTSALPPASDWKAAHTGSSAHIDDDTTSYTDILETRASSMALPAATERVSFKRYETAGYLDHGTFDQATIDTPLADDNRGMKLLMKMGWKKDTPLGRAGGNGLVVPLQLVDAGLGGEGLGKGREYDTTAEEATRSRRLLDVEVKETVAIKEERALKAAKEEALKQELKAVVREFYCDICGKQYAGVSDFAVHLSGYEHGHTKRLKEAKEANRARTAAKAGNQAKQDQARHLKQMQRRMAAAGVKTGNAATKAAVPVPHPAPPSNTVSPLNPSLSTLSFHAAPPPQPSALPPPPPPPPQPLPGSAYSPSHPVSSLPLPPLPPPPESAYSRPSPSQHPPYPHGGPAPHLPPSHLHHHQHHPSLPSGHAAQTAGNYCHTHSHHSSPAPPPPPPPPPPPLPPSSALPSFSATASFPPASALSSSPHTLSSAPTNPSLSTELPPTGSRAPMTLSMSFASKAKKRIGR
ncbi:g patch domain-containing protein 8 [Nannochloropsis gaditana]|uniref:G patch domain-containing protein 8 n=2 Tax=Nannochloropsis gaditana TaxID=72520 RepID=W7T5T6_9STRA|nr:g patch domain-containing protein 8 [Nannochloropsis gaditana]